METTIFGNLKATPLPLWTWPSKWIRQSHGNTVAWNPDTDAWYTAYWTGVTVANKGYIESFGDGFINQYTMTTGYAPSRFMMLNPGTYKFLFNAEGNSVTVYKATFVRSGDAWIYSSNTTVNISNFTIENTGLYMFEFWNRNKTINTCKITDIVLEKVS